MPMDAPSTVVLITGLGWASSVPLYAVLFIVFVLWLLPTLWRGAKRVFSTLRHLPGPPS